MVAPEVMEDERAGSEGVGGDDVRTGPDVIFMNRPDDLGVREVGLRAPGLATHGNATALDVGSRSAIEDDGLTAAQLVREQLVVG